MDATKSDNGEKLCNNIHSRSSQPFKVTQNKPLSSKNRGEDLRQPEVMEDIAQAVEDINEDVTNKNREEEKGKLFFVFHDNDLRTYHVYNCYKYVIQEHQKEKLVGKPCAKGFMEKLWKSVKK